MTQMFSVEGVSVSYGKVEAVRNVSLSVEEGQIVQIDFRDDANAAEPEWPSAISPTTAQTG